MLKCAAIARNVWCWTRCGQVWLVGRSAEAEHTSGGLVLSASRKAPFGEIESFWVGGSDQQTFLSSVSVPLGHKNLEKRAAGGGVARSSHVLKPPFAKLVAYISFPGTAQMRARPGPRPFVTPPCGVILNCPIPYVQIHLFNAIERIRKAGGPRRSSGRCLRWRAAEIG